MSSPNVRHRSFVEILERRKRLILYLTSFVVIVAVQTVLYAWGMARFEGDPRTLQESFGIVTQSITTTGYGQDAPWESTFVSALVIVAQFTGIAYLFIALPLFGVPWLRDAFVDPNVPERIGRLEDHVIVGGSEPFYSALLADLTARDVPAVVVEDDVEQAKRLHTAGENVITGDLSTDRTLEGADVGDARAVVVDADGADAIGTTLSVRTVDEDLHVVCLVEDPAQSRYLRYAGASTVLSPKHRLGKSVADKAQNVVGTELGRLEGDVDLDIAEFAVTADSSIHGRRFEDFDALTASGATLVGAWVRGEFVTTLPEDARIDRSTALVVAGTDEQLARVEDRTGIVGRQPTDGPVVVVGNGIVGVTANGVLRRADVETTTVDAEQQDAVDVVGDPTSASTLREAGVDSAATVVVCLADDSDAVKATLVATVVNPGVEVVVAASDVESTDELHRAGADYVLSLPKVAARMTTLDIFGEGVMRLCERVDVTTVDAVALEGTHPSDEALERRTGITVVGVRRDGDLRTDFGPEFEITAGDDVFVAGSTQEIDRFRRDDADSPSA